MIKQGWAYAIVDGPDGQGYIAYSEHGAMIFTSLRSARNCRQKLPYPSSWSIVRVHMETEPFALQGNGRALRETAGQQLDRLTKIITDTGGT